MAKTTDTISCPHHFEILKETSVNSSKIEAIQDKTIPELKHEIEVLAAKLETRSIEEEAYRQSVRMMAKSIEDLENESQSFVKRGELRPIATKESVDDLSKVVNGKASKEGLEGLNRWVVSGWIATVLVILGLLFDIILRLRGH